MRKMRIVLFLLLLFFLANTPVEEVEGADPDKICKEYSEEFKDRFSEICEGSEPKKSESSEKWKIDDSGAFSGFIKNSCISDSDYYWNPNANSCEKRTKCNDEEYWIIMTNSCKKLYAD